MIIWQSLRLPHVSFRRSKSISTPPTPSQVDYPIIADDDRAIAAAFGMLDPAETDASGRAFAARSVFVFGPDGRLRLSLLYPSSTGRSFDELLRVLDSLQLAEAHPVATPADWRPGEEVMIAPRVSDEEAEQRFPGFRTIRDPRGKRRRRSSGARREEAVREAAAARGDAIFRTSVCV